MSKETPQKSSIQSSEGDLNARLLKASDLSRRFRYSEGLQVLEQLLNEHAHENTLKEVLKAAGELRSNIRAQRRTFYARMIIVLLFIVSVLSVGILYFRVSSTEIIADLEVQGVYFELEHDSAIESNPIDSIILNDIEQLVMYAEAVDGLSVETIERTIASAPQEDNDLNPNEPIIIRTDEVSGTLRISGKYLRLQRFDLYGDVSIQIESAGSPNPTVTIRQSINKAYGVIDTGNDIYIECPSCELRQRDNKPVALAERFHISLSLHELNFKGQKRPVDVALVLLPKEEMEQKNVISEMTHLKTVDFTSSGHQGMVSLIRSGVIKFTEWNNKEVYLSENEFLKVEGLKNFRIMRLVLGNPMHLRLRGNVNSLKTGSGTVSPTLLELVLVNKAMSLFTTTVSVVFTFLLAAFLRLKIIPKD